MENRFETFVSSISELNRCIQKIKDNEMKKFGLKASHTLCLYFLGENNEGLTSSELTKKCNEDKAAISRSLNELENVGLVASEKSDGKRNYRNLHHLTNKGKDVVQKINKKIDTILSKCSEGLSINDRNTFYSYMSDILNNLKNYQEESEL